MRKLIVCALTALTFTATFAFAAHASEPITAVSGDPVYNMLYTESTWMSLEVPTADLGNIIPNDLSLAVSGQPDGTTITFNGVSSPERVLLGHSSMLDDPARCPVGRPPAGGQTET